MRTAVILAATLMLLALACTAEVPQPPAGSIAAAATAAAAESGRSETATADGTTGQAGHAPQAIPQDAGERREKPERGNRPETITVMGRGSASGMPDIVRLSLGAVSRGSDPGELAGDVMNATAALAQAALDGGVAEDDIRTSAFRIREDLRYDPVEHRQVRDGFEAAQQTVVTVRDPASAGTLMAQLIEAVGNAGAVEATVQGVSTEIEDTRVLGTEALEDATMNMWERAMVVAAGSGREICRLLEAGADGARPAAPRWEPPYGRDAFAMEAASAGLRGGSPGPSLSPGTITESARITGTFALTAAGQPRDEALCGQTP